MVIMSHMHYAEILRQVAGLLFGLCAMASIMGILTGLVTAFGPGNDTVAWGIIAVLGILGLAASVMALGALSY